MPQTEPKQLSQAVIFEGPNRPLKSAELPLPKSIGPGDAIVEVECCTICGSDLHSIQGHRAVPTPSILGHEIVGSVVQVGDPPANDINGMPLVRGDRVTWSVVVGCESCDRCDDGLPQKCRQLFKYGHEVSEGHYGLNGGLAEFVVLQKGTQIAKISDSIPKEVICPANCATATVANAYRQVQAIEHKNVLIFGCGMLGLTAAAFADAQSANRVVVCDVNDHRLQQSKQFGASHQVKWSDDINELKDRLARTTGVAEFDVVLELSGSSQAVSAAIELAAIGSTVVLAGSVSPADAVPIDPEAVVRRCMTIVGIHNYAPCDLETAVEFLERNYNRYPFAELVQREFRLHEIQDAIEYALAEKPVRIAICP